MYSSVDGSPEQLSGSSSNKTLRAKTTFWGTENLNQKTESTSCNRSISSSRHLKERLMSQTQLSDETIQKTHGTDLQSIPERSAFRPVARFSGALLLRAFLPSLIAVMAMVFLPQSISAQGLELSGGWVHVTQNFGTDGFDAGAAWWFTPKIILAANYDDTWDTTQIGVFQITNVGLLVSKTHLQSFLIGPRIFFYSRKVKKYKLGVFGETQYGVSHINSTLQQVPVASVSASDTAFTWTLGGGADYPFTPHWSARGNVDLMRTHFAAAGQSRLRLVLGIGYTFGSREK
jgi:hypothetical protein